MEHGIPSVAEARAILEEFTSSPNLRTHAHAVAAGMRAYAEKYGESPDRWEIVGLLHDFDYEKFPTLEDHPFRGAEILRSRGVGEDVIQDIFAHAPHTGQERDTPLRKAIFACDELAGFIVAVALVQPTKKLSEVTVERVLKKLRQKGFAAAVSREDIERGAAELRVSLPEHVHTVLTALQRTAPELGL
ncbi:MAG: metal dependent phosphohydrolase [Parcubacteria group bacterium Gr01-1014_106]|nr:MAG: metal dependent phosphohydrolase [Parcubacteria group bacterium Gr01-1014_106]